VVNDSQQSYFYSLFHPAADKRYKNELGRAIRHVKRMSWGAQ